MRHLATIQKIAAVEPIEGADSIEKVKVRDWWCVSKKGEFKAGDFCVYFEIDSLLPITNKHFEFLGKGSKPKKVVVDGKEYEGYRLKTIRLRGQISQGLALGIHVMPPVFTFVPDTDLGRDVSDFLEVVKYEPPMPAELAGVAKGPFPGFIPKTDEERVQNMGDVIERHLNEPFRVTEKLDGSSATFFKTADGVFGVCSRNLELLPSDSNTLWRMARQYSLEEKLPNGFAVQGEVIGEGIQKNPLKIKGHDFFAYNVWSISESRYLDPGEASTFCSERGIKMVPVVFLKHPLMQVSTLLTMADGDSVLSPGCPREGLVFRPLKESRETIGGQDSRFSFKAISNNYLEKYED